MPSQFSVKLVREAEVPYDGDLEVAGNATAASRYARNLIADEPTEVVGVILTNLGHEVIGHSIVARGGIGVCTVEVRGILLPAMLSNAASVIMMHNHPSGGVAPSPDDIAITRKAVDGGKLLDINVVDHIIVGSGGNWSSLRCTNPEIWNSWHVG